MAMDWAPVYLAVGGNVGDVPAQLRRVVGQLEASAHFANVRLSRMFQTAPVGADAGEPFVNAAIGCQTLLGAEAILDVCQTLEQQAGRVRTVHWGPRPLDVDLLGLGQLQWNSPRLQLPHPRLWYRRFVLDPLADVAAEWNVPGREATVRELRERLEIRPLTLAIAVSVADREQLIRSLRARFEPEEVHVTAAEQRDAAEATWHLIDPRHDPDGWLAASPSNRVAVTDWADLRDNDLVFMLQSALDRPEVIS